MNVIYKPNVCNIKDCSNSEYKNHMCKEHYDFYMKDYRVVSAVHEIEALETGSADWKLKTKSVLHFIIHHLLNIPMLLCEHFPLEHIYLAELNTLLKEPVVDIERFKTVKTDFDIPKNENLATIERLLNFRDIDTSDLGLKEKVRLEKRDLPSKMPIILSLLGVLFLITFLYWKATPVLLVRGYELSAIQMLFQRYLPIAMLFALAIILGSLIPSHFNYFVDRCYSMTLFKGLEDNVDLVNQVKYVKDRKSRAGSYFATLYGSSMGISSFLVVFLFYRETVFSWQTVLFVTGILLVVVPLFYSYAVMALYYPVTGSLIRKRVAIDLFNADMHGGLKHYHQFLFKLFLYNEGVVVVFLSIFYLLHISWAWIILLIALLLPRFTQAGWSLIRFFCSILDFHKEKMLEKKRLMIIEGTIENLMKINELKKIHATSVVPILKFLLVAIIIPLFVGYLARLFNRFSYLGIHVE